MDGAVRLLRIQMFFHNFSPSILFMQWWSHRYVKGGRHTCLLA
jgi:hypothetical protein